jgi:hypothetical protein
VPLAATRKVTTDSPWPVDASLVSHGALDCTLHAQSRLAVTPTVPIPPAAANGPGTPVVVTPQRGLLGAESCSTAVDPHPGNETMTGTRRRDAQRTREG